MRVLICSEISGPWSSLGWSPAAVGVKVGSGTEYDLFGGGCQPFFDEGRLDIGAENASCLSNIAIRGWEACSLAPSGDQAQ